MIRALKLYPLSLFKFNNHSESVSVKSQICFTNKFIILGKQLSSVSNGINLRIKNKKSGRLKISA